MAVRFDVPFDRLFFEFYKTLKDSDSPSFPPLIPESEISSKTEEMKKKIKNKTIKHHIIVLYDSLYKHCHNALNGVNMETAVNEFEGYLRKKTGQHYEIKLVVDGNL